jgi:hypothetical protein
VEKRSANFQLVDANPPQPFANVPLAARPCRLLRGFDGEAPRNFQLVDRNLIWQPANLKKDPGAVTASVGNGKEPGGIPSRPDEA